MIAMLNNAARYKFKKCTCQSVCPSRTNQQTLISYLAFKRNRPCCFHPHLFPINLCRGNLSRAWKPEPKCCVGKKNGKKKINISIFAKGHSLIDLPMSNTSESKDVCCVLLKLCVARWVGKNTWSILVKIRSRERWFTDGILHFWLWVSDP